MAETTEDYLPYVIGISALVAGGAYLATRGKSTTGTNTVTITCLDNGAPAPAAFVTSSPNGISGTADSNGMLVVTGVLSGTYIITVTYGGLSNQGTLAVPNAFAVTIDVDVPNPNFTVVLSGGSASTDGISANASVTNAQTPYTDIKIIGEAVQFTRPD